MGRVVQNLDVDRLGLRGGGGLLAGAGVTEVARVRAAGHLESDAVSGCEPMADRPELEGDGEGAIGDERAWERDGNLYSGPHWPERIPEGELAAVLLMQSHGGHWRGQPAEIAVPTFSHGVPAPGPDIEHPYEPFALALLIGWMKLALADEHQAALLAPPLIDVIGRVPKPRIPRDLGITWPLEPSEPHIRPRRR